MAYSNAYHFQTVWEFDAPVEQVWDTVFHSLDWPKWWKGMIAVRELKAGAPSGTGSVRRYLVRSPVGYRLCFDLEVTDVALHTAIRGVASGQLEGNGVWAFSGTARGTRVTINWLVSTRVGWMNHLSPVLRPFFRWNHDRVMHQGYQGLKKQLEALRPPV